MKTSCTKTLNMLSLCAAFFLVVPFGAKGQNLLVNSSFNSGTMSWDINGMTVDVNPETTYGGRFASNKAAEIDKVAGLRQKVAITAGKIYQITYKASRRKTGATPADPGINIQVFGDVTGASYLNNSKIYTNTVFAYTDEIITFTVPSNSIDNIIVLQFTGYNNPTAFGVIVDDIVLTLLSSLPVQLISFTGELHNGQTVLNWKTASEVNNKKFVIERSANGNQFDSIGMVRAASGNTSVKNYTFTDSKLNSGANYYRLRQVDIDGTNSYSKVVVVKSQGNNEGVKIFPTLATTNVNFSLSSPEKGSVMVSVYDATGKKMIHSMKAISPGANQQSIEVSSLGRGLYYLHIQNTDGSLNFIHAFQKVN